MAPILDKNSLPTQACFIDNQYRDATGTELELVNPKDASQIATFNEASQDDVDAAVAAALKAYKTGPWSGFTGAQRAKCMLKLADLIEENGEALAYFESICSGRPLAQVQGADIPRLANCYRYYAGWADKLKGDAFPPEDGFYKIVEHAPLGVCVGVYAWNGSFYFLAAKSAPALACGNTVVMKPSEKSPLGSMGFAGLVEAAGFPTGVFNFVTGGRVAGAALSEHMDVAKISFTGSTATGKAIQAAAIKSNMKRVTLELGGKSPAIVFADAKMDTAVFWCVVGITSNSGQVCAATSRVYVEESIADEFIGRLKDTFEGIGKGLGQDPQEAATSYGPLVDKVQFDKVLEYIEDGKKDASLIVGAEQKETKGFYVAPVIFKDPSPSSRIYKEEIFGPVLVIKTFKEEAEALELANDTQYGLAGAVYTKDIARALRVSSKIQSGTVGINCTSLIGTQVPMGGFKSSGSGRELGEYALRHYTETRTIWINMHG